MPRQVVSVTHAELAARFGREDLAGVLVVSTVTASAEVTGPRTYPSWSRLYAHRQHSVMLQAGDVLRLAAWSKDGMVTLRGLLQCQSPNAVMPSLPRFEPLE